MTKWAINAIVTVKDEMGQSTHRIPTFALDAKTYGIRHMEDAEKAAHLVLSCGIPSMVDADIIASPRYV